MRKYVKPEFDVEKFTVADIITTSSTEETTTTKVENDMDDDLFGSDSVGLEINDEF